nr:hypothetical protein [Anaerolineae bacterium]
MGLVGIGVKQRVSHACEHADAGPCRFVSVDGLVIHLVEEGSGLPVVLVHGGQGWAYTWRHQLEPLSGAGYRAIAPDLPYSDLRGHWASIVGGLALSLVLIVPALWLRIRQEEAMLLIEFGDEYREYMARTWRLIPFVF